MANENKDGGQAFPRGAHPQWNEFSSKQNPGYTPQSGMTLRDWFAGQALASSRIAESMDFGIVAGRAYQCADAMLAARSGERK